MPNSDFLALAHQAADKAGEILRGYFKQDYTTELKDDQSPVTQADRAVEQVVRELIKHKFPDHGIIGEECGAENPQSEYQWVIDPIDGTKAFIAGKPTFTTLIALCKNGEPVLGIIDQPVTPKRWAALSSETPSQGLDVPERYKLATTSMDYFTPVQKVAYERVREKAGSITLGGDAFLYGQLADGGQHVVLDAGMKVYDYMALVPVVKAAGGVISDWSGSPLTLASEGDVVACANAELHKKILGMLQHD